MTFQTALEIERLEDRSHGGRGTWRLLAVLVYQSSTAGTIVVPTGYVTDLASVPRVPLVYWAVGGLAHEAAVVHDWLYTTHQTTRAQADAVLREAAQDCGMSAWRAWIMWAGVRAGGALAWNNKGEKNNESDE